MHASFWRVSFWRFCQVRIFLSLGVLQRVKRVHFFLMLVHHDKEGCWVLGFFCACVFSRVACVVVFLWGGKTYKRQAGRWLRLVLHIVLSKRTGRCVQEDVFAATFTRIIIYLCSAPRFLNALWALRFLALHLYIWWYFFGVMPAIMIQTTLCSRGKVKPDGSAYFLISLAHHAWVTSVEAAVCNKIARLFPSFCSEMYPFQPWNVSCSISRFFARTCEGGKYHMADMIFVIF